MLGIYNSDQLLVSNSSNFTNPLRTHHEGKNGGSSIVKGYVRNDDTDFYYQNVKVTPVDNSGYDDTIGEWGTGFSIKLAYGTVEPLPHEWNLINSGDYLEMPDVGTSSIADNTTYFPFWIRVNVPGNTPAQNKRDIKLRLQFIKRPII